MYVEERQAEILQHLASRPLFPVNELQRVLGVSRSTLRRDLMELEKQGRLVRVHGGVMHPLHLKGEATHQARRGERGQAKRRIAEQAAASVAAGASVYLDAGTTCLELGKRLLLRKDIRLFTHSIPLAAVALTVGGEATITCIGGELRPVSGALIGPTAQRWLGRLRVDIAFLGASGLHPTDGPSTTELSEAAVKSSIMKRARRAILLADTSKCTCPAAVGFAGWTDFDLWVIDGRPPAEFRHTGVRIRRA